MSSPPIDPKPKPKRPSSAKRIAKRLGRAQDVLATISPHSYDAGTSVAGTKCDCPKCFEQLAIPDILRGFSTDPLVPETTCFTCQAKFLAVLALANGNHFVYIGPDQTRAQFQEYLNRKPNEDEEGDLFTAAPHIAWSAHLHSFNHNRYTTRDAVMTFLNPEASFACGNCGTDDFSVITALSSGSTLTCSECDGELGIIPDNLRESLVDQFYCNKRAKLE
jgi:predicted nucleic acid-binding Zn ribbon protein